MCKKNQKYCPSLVVMLRTLCNMRNKEICDLLGYTSSAVGNIISRHELADKIHYRNIDKDAVEAEYLAGATTYELADKYGVMHQTIGKWMKQRGHVRGKGFIGTRKRADAKKRAEGKRIFEEWLTEEYGDRFTCLEYINNNTPYKLRCNECGLEFTRWPDKTQAIRCPTCYKKQLEQNRIKREFKKQEREQVRKKLLAEEYAKEKKCCICGSVFHSERPEAKYCSDDCRRVVKRKRNLAQKKRRGSWANHRKRARHYGVAYEPGISLKQLIKRDGLTCRICGGMCNLNDKNDKHIGLTYPTIDHIVAMKNGGGHTWDNVQIAHMICNSYKRDLTEDELTDEVITHAKEQAIAHKCA